jgi:hypothetical protein
MKTMGHFDATKFAVINDFPLFPVSAIPVVFIIRMRDTNDCKLNIGETWVLLAVITK